MLESLINAKIQESTETEKVDRKLQVQVGHLYGRT